MQSISQLRYVYGDQRATIILDNCDSFVYLGAGSSYESSEYVSRLCGTKEIGTQLVGIERNKSSITQLIASPSDISRLPRHQCIVKISGEKPFLTEKFDVMRHPNAAQFLKLETEQPV